MHAPHVTAAVTHPVHCCRIAPSDIDADFMRIRNLIIAFVLGGAIAAGLGVALSLRDAPAVPNVATIVPAGDALPEFSLLDQGGRAVDRGLFAGQWDLVFFGFTNCPDICPTTLQDLSQVKREILARGVPDEAIQFVFISVDPARDKSEQITKYVTYFDPGFQGATGSIGQLNNLTRQLGAPFMAEENKGDDIYEVAHSSAVYLIDPQQRYTGMISSPFSAAEVAEQFADLYRATEG